MIECRVGVHFVVENHGTSSSGAVAYILGGVQGDQYPHSLYIIYKRFRSPSLWPLIFKMVLLDKIITPPPRQKPKYFTE